MIQFTLAGLRVSGTEGIGFKEMKFLLEGRRPRTESCERKCLRRLAFLKGHSADQEDVSLGFNMVS